MSGTNITLQIDVREIKKSLNNITNLLNDFKTKAHETITPKIDTTNVNTAIKETSNTFSQFACQTVYDMGRIGLALAPVTKMFNSLKSSLSGLVVASNTQEKATQNLISSLRLQGQATQENIKRFEDFANTMSKLTTTNDEVVTGLLSMGINLGITNNNIEDSVRGAIGLSKAFEGFGMTQENALRGIAKALEGNFSTLQRYIPELMSANTEAEKMEILQRNMANGFRLAQDETKTAYGAIKQFHNTVGDFKENLGDLVKNAMLPVIRALTRLTQYLNDNKNIIKYTIAPLGALTIAVVGLNAVILTGIGLYKYWTMAKTALIPIKATLAAVTVKLTVAIKSLTTAMLANPKILLIATLAGALGVLIQYLTRFVRTGKQTEEILDDIGDAAEETEFKLNNLSRALDLRKINEDLKALRDSFKDAGTLIWDRFNLELRVLREAVGAGKISLEEATKYVDKVFQKRKKMEMKNEIEIAEIKVRVGRKTQEELKKIINDYYNWVAQNGFEKNTREYLEALSKKLNAEADIRRERERLLTDLESLENNLKSRRELILKDFADRKQLLDNGLAQGLRSQAEYNALLIQLEENRDAELKNIRRQEFQEQITLFEKNKHLGILTYADLKKVTDEYYQWAKVNYAKNSQEYIIALNMMRTANLRYGQEKKAQKQALLNDMSSLWQNSARMYDSNLIGINELKDRYLDFQQVLVNQSRIADQRVQELQHKLNELKTVGKDLDLYEIDKLSAELLKAKIEADSLRLSMAELHDQMSDFTSLTNRLDHGIKASMKAMRDYIRQTGREIDLFIHDVMMTGLQSIQNSMSTVLSQMIMENKKFTDIMKSIWKSFATTVINEINRIIVQMMLLRALKGAVSFVPGGQVVAVATGYSSGGYTGDGGKYDPAGIVHKGEYVINKEKTGVLRPLLDVLNYSPMPALQSVIASLRLPALPMPALPKMSYATGGYVNPASFGDSFKERQSGFNMAAFAKEVINELKHIKQKEHKVDVNVRTQWDAVTLVREIDRANKIYKDNIM